MKFLIVTSLFLGLYSLPSLANHYKYTKPFSVVPGSIIGMTITTELPPEHPLRRVGVRKNDVVLSVDYSPIHNEIDAKQAYDAKDFKRVSILRKNQRISLEKN